MKTPFTNHQDHAVFVGGVMVGPGQTRDVNPDFLPPADEAGPDLEALCTQIAASSQNQAGGDPIVAPASAQPQVGGEPIVPPPGPEAEVLDAATPHPLSEEDQVGGDPLVTPPGPAADGLDPPPPPADLDPPPPPPAVVPPKAKGKK